MAAGRPVRRLLSLSRWEETVAWTEGVDEEEKRNAKLTLQEAKSTRLDWLLLLGEKEVSGMASGYRWEA